MNSPFSNTKLVLFSFLKHILEAYSTFSFTYNFLIFVVIICLAHFLFCLFFLYFVRQSKKVIIRLKGEVTLGDRSSPLSWLSSACRGAHFPVVEKVNGTGLAMCLALYGCQGTCDKVSNGPASSYSGSFNIRQGLKC